MYIHRGLVAHICVGDLCQRWFGLRAFRMNGVKSLAKPTLTYCQLGMCEQPSLKIVSIYNNLHLRKCIWKSRNLTRFCFNMLTPFVMSLSLSGVEFGAPHGGVELVNNGSCDGLVPDGNSPLFWSNDPMCIDHYHHWLFIHLFIY